MPLGCSVMRNSRLKIVRGEFLTCFDYYDKFHVNLLFDRSIYRPMCTHMGYSALSHRKLVSGGKAIEPWSSRIPDFQEMDIVHQQNMVQSLFEGHMR